MKRRPFYYLFLALTAFGLLSSLYLSGGFFLFFHDTILRVSSGSVTTLQEIVPDLKRSRVVFVGELHDNEFHHEAQLRVIRSLKEAGLSVAVGLEMFQAKNQSVLDQWVSDKIVADEFIRAYYANWKIPWPLYRDIFLYAKENRIPLIGLNVPPEITRQVAEKGFESLSGEQLTKLPGVSCNVDPDYEKFIRKALGAHGGKKSFRYFCEAQMVWDSTMARNILTFMNKNPHHTVVVLAGGGHAWKPGIPEQVRRHSGDIAITVILPELSSRIDRGNVTLKEADYLWLDL